MEHRELAKARLPLATLMPALPRAMLAAMLLASGVVVWRGGSLQGAARMGAAAAAGSGIFMLALVLVCALTYPVTVYTDGIASYDPFGSWKKDFLHWEAMSAVVPKSILGIKYLRVESLEGRRLWIPLAALSVQDLRRAISATAPAASPLGQVLSGPAA